VIDNSEELYDYLENNLADAQVIFLCQNRLLIRPTSGSAQFPRFPSQYDSTKFSAYIYVFMLESRTKKISQLPTTACELWVED